MLAWRLCTIDSDNMAGAETKYERSSKCKWDAVEILSVQLIVCSG